MGAQLPPPPWSVKSIVSRGGLGPNRGGAHPWKEKKI